MDARGAGDFLRTMRTFAHIAEADLATLAASMRDLRLRSGQMLLHEGDRGAQMYFVRDGSLAIAKHITGGVEQVVAHVGAGEFVGEMSLFDRRPRSASIRAETDTQLLVLDRAAVQTLIDTNPGAAAALLRVLSGEFIARLRRSNALIAEVTSAVLAATNFRVEDWRGE